MSRYDHGPMSDPESEEIEAWHRTEAKAESEYYAMRMRQAHPYFLTMLGIDEDEL